MTYIYTEGAKNCVHILREEVTVYVYRFFASLCVGVCVCVYIYIYMYVCVCVCVCQKMNHYIR